jgi:hypothetical protein
MPCKRKLNKTTLHAHETTILCKKGDVGGVMMKVNQILNLEKFRNDQSV